MSTSASVRIGVLTVSDRASREEYEDRGGPAIVDYLNEVLATDFQPVRLVVADDLETIVSAIRELSQTCPLVVTTGGTGPALRDVTPEATEAACQKMMPGFGELMRNTSLQYVPTAILSRQTAGICGNALVVNLPGQPKAVAECLEAVFPAIPYCIDLLDGPYITTRSDRLVAFRPKSSRPRSSSG